MFSVLRTPDMRMLYVLVKYITRIVQPNALHTDSLDPISMPPLLRATREQAEAETILFD